MVVIKICSSLDLLQSSIMQSCSSAVCTAFSLIYFYFHHLSLVGHGGKKALVYPSTVSPSVWAMH